MRIKRMRRICSVPRCKNTDTIAIGKSTALDLGTVFLCRECAKNYAKAWSDADKAERDAKAAERASKGGEA